MTSVTEKRLDKVRVMAEMFERFEKSGLQPIEFCKLEGIHASKFYYWRDRFQRMGTNGLVDKREGIPYKMTEDVREYIRRVKTRNPMKSGADISRMIKRRFGKKVSVFHVQRHLKDMGLNDPVGRKTGKPVKKTRN